MFFNQFVETEFLIHLTCYRPSLLIFILKYEIQTEIRFQVVVVPLTTENERVQKEKIFTIFTLLLIEAHIITNGCTMITLTLLVLAVCSLSLDVSSILLNKEHVDIIYLHLCCI